MRMSKRFGWCLSLSAVAAVAIWSAVSLPTSAAELKRRKASCTVYEDRVKGTPDAKSYTSGSWGGVPPGLRKLPPNATLCGADARGVKEGAAVIVSSLVGHELETFYGPLFEKIGCKPLACKVTPAKVGKLDTEWTECACHGDRMLGHIATDAWLEMFTLSFAKW